MEYKKRKIYGTKCEHVVNDVVFEPSAKQSIRLNFDKFKRNGEWIDLRMQINYSEDDKMFYAQMYARDEDGRFTDLKLQVEFEQLDLSKSVEDKLRLVYKDE